MPDDATELAALRAEVALLRSDLDRALALLDLPCTQDRRESEWPWPEMVLKSVVVRHCWKQMPITLDSDHWGSAVALQDANNQTRGRFGITPDGQVQLEILNAEGKVAVSIGEGEGGRGEIRVNAADGTPRAGLKAGELGGVMSLVDAQGQVLAAVMGSDAGGQVLVCSAALKTAVTLKSLPEGGTIILAEPGGQTMGHFTVTTQGSALTVYGEQGEPAVMLSGLGEMGGKLLFFTHDGEMAAMLPP